MATHPFEQLQLTESQSECFALGLVDLAQSDGLHDNEVELIEEFLSSSGGGQLDTLMNKGFSPVDAARLLQDDVRDAFFYTCYLLAYADGALSAVESGRIDEYALAFGIGDDALGHAHNQARSFLVGSLAQELKNQTLVREIATQLGMTSAQIDSALQGGN